MTLIQSRATLTHRLTVQRDSNVPASSIDEWGNPLPPTWEDWLVDVPCKAWTVSPKLSNTTATTSQTLVEERRAIIPLGTDVTESDRVSQITIRGQVFWDGPMQIRAVLAYEDHLELILTHALRAVA